MDKELLTVDDIRGVLGVSRWKAYQMMARGELPTLRVGRQVRVPRRAFLEWIEANTRDAESSRSEAA